MTMPNRPAPPPPKPGVSQTSRTQWTNKQQFTTSTVQQKKSAPPPRPPPPKVSQAPPRQPPKQSVNILSNLFTSKKNQNKSNENVNLKKSQEIKVPPKIPAPPTSLLFMRDQNLQPRQTSDVQLISFDSPSSSPTLTQKSSTSDCVSVDSFSSDSNYSPNNGGICSQAESGFEDDFSVADLKFQSVGLQKRSVNLLEDPFELDPFAPNQQQQTSHFPTNIRNVKHMAQPKPVTLGNTSFYASTNSFASSSSSSLAAMRSATPIDNSLCNGKNLLPAPSPVTMPTIIKPVSNKGKSPAPTPPLAAPQQPKKQAKNELKDCFTLENSFDDDLSLPSLPMPNVPPPPLPKEFLEETVESDVGKEPYGIALFDFDSGVDEDLSFKVSFLQFSFTF